MAAQFENEKFDYIISGTSLYKSILSAALSRAGQKVLHVDPNSYYGSEFETSFDLKTLSEKQNTSETILGPKFSEFSSNKNLNRKFIIDLCPRLLYANGSMVKLLIDSKIHKYLEFRHVGGFYIEDESKLLSVPCSKSALFTTTSLTAVEKRKMMKFINENTSEKDSSNQNSTSNSKNEISDQTIFGDYLKTLDLTPKLEKYITSCLAFSSKDDTLKMVKHRIDLFLTSYGRYGQSAFLFPLYGNAELHQAFCRLSAVFGATFCLNYENPEKLKSSCEAKEYIFDEPKNITNETSKKLFKSVVIMTDKMFIDSKNKETNKKESETEAGSIDLIILDDNITVFQISGKAGNIAPVGVYIYYFSCPSLEKLKNRISSLVGDFESSHVLTSHLEEKVECVFDYESEVLAAKDTFHRLVGSDVEFLEAAPESEDIIRDDK